MKRKFKRIASLVLAAVMVFAMAMPTMASASEGTDKKSITITEVPGKGHVFKAYQIFKGDVYDKEPGDDHNYDTTSGKDEILSNIQWGNGLTETGRGILAEQVGSTTTEASDVAKALANKSSAELQGIIEAIKAYLKEPISSTAPTAEGDTTYIINNLDAGYYLVIDDANETLTGTAAYSSYIVEVVGDATVKAKADVPKLEKKVQEKDDSTNADAKWQDGADYDIGDAVPFKLEATLPSNYGEYDAYKLVFHDRMSSGLTFGDLEKESIVVKFGEKEIKGSALETGVTLNIGGSETENPCTFELTIDDVKTTFPDAVAGSVITVTFNATLNDEAAIGNPGNTNEAKLEYSNNPNNEEETGTTPEDKVVVFTFDVDVHKVQPNPENPEETIPLVGAAFTLYKWMVGEGVNALPDATAGGEEPGYWMEVEVIDHTTDGETTFKFNGEDSGIYKLVETVTPPGFNTAAPIDFTITATYDTNSNDPKLTGLTITPNAGKFNVTMDSGLIETDVVNNEGTTLPETGGIGTTIFYVVGSVLVLGAVILLVTKRRMKSE